MPEAANISVPRTAEAQQVMRRGSVSFFLAAKLLPANIREAVMLLYAWCRHCDDVIDGQSLGHGKMAPRDEVRSLGPVVDRLAEATRLATAGGAAEPVFAGMGWVCRRHQIPAIYPMDLLAGMRMDVEGWTYRTIDGLGLYCYRVAGTVGVMFSYISGVSDPKALRHAVDLGVAMQLTNIARDILTDHAAGRVYLPTDWLEAEGLTQDTCCLPENRRALVAVVDRVLDAADFYYKSGDEGLHYLPTRVALAVASARHIYAEIGHQVRNRGPLAWDRRVSVSLPRKLRLVLRAFTQVLRLMPQRARNPWRPTVLSETKIAMSSWRPS